MVSETFIVVCQELDGDVLSVVSRLVKVCGNSIGDETCKLRRIFRIVILDLFFEAFAFGVLKVWRLLCCEGEVFYRAVFQ